MNTPHPEINRKLCWNLHPHRTPCTDCMDICPHGADIFQRANLVKDWTACTNCGLCVSVCRSRCISPASEQVRQDLAPVDTDNDFIWIGCDQSTRHNDLVRDCVGALTWEALAYLALNKKVVLDLTPCGECEKDKCAEHLRAELTRLVEFFGEAMFCSRFTLAYEQDQAPYQTKSLSRREMFSHMTDSSKNSAKQLLRILPGMKADNSDSSMDFRLALNHRVKQLKAASETPPRYGWHLPAFTDKCFGCGKCEKACHAGALKLEDLPDGQTRVVITPWKCSECGLCVSACNTHAIDGMKLRQLTSLGPVSVFRFKKTLCKTCGKPVAPGSTDGLCSVCRVKARTKQRQEAAAERVRKRKAEAEAKKAAEAEAQKAAQAQQTAEAAANAEAEAPKTVEAAAKAESRPPNAAEAAVKPEAEAAPAAGSPDSL